jgi:hypothetical protein
MFVLCFLFFLCLLLGGLVDLLGSALLLKQLADFASSGEVMKSMLLRLVDPLISGGVDRVRLFGFEVLALRVRDVVERDRLCSV